MGRRLIILDTSGIFTILNRRDPKQALTRAALFSDPGPRLVPAPILGELAYVVESRLGAHVLDAFLADLERGRFLLDCGFGDIGRIRYLTRRYADLPRGFSDASVIACAERNGGRLLTLDRRDFGVVARQGRITIVP